MHLTLAKASPHVLWTTLGTVEMPPNKPLISVRIHSSARQRLTSPRQVTAYSWADETRGVRVWVRVPGVHLLSAAAVTVRFRELSFDVLVSGPSADYTFAVTELPMEIVVSECAW